MLLQIQPEWIYNSNRTQIETDTERQIFFPSYPTLFHISYIKWIYIKFIGALQYVKVTWLIYLSSCCSAAIFLLRNYTKNKDNPPQTDAARQHNPQLSAYLITFSFSHFHIFFKSKKKKKKSPHAQNTDAMFTCAWASEHLCFLSWPDDRGRQPSKAAVGGMWMPAGVIVILWSRRISQMSHTPPGLGQGCKLWLTTASVVGSKRRCVSPCPINTATGQ